LAQGRFQSRVSERPRSLPGTVLHAQPRSGCRRLVSALPLRPRRGLVPDICFPAPISGSWLAGPARAGSARSGIDAAEGHPSGCRYRGRTRRSHPQPGPWPIKTLAGSIIFNFKRLGSTRSELELSQPFRVKNNKAIKYQYIILT